MIEPRFGWKTFVATFALSCGALLGMFLVPGNPDYAFPLLPELLALGCMGALGWFLFGKSRDYAQRDSAWAIGRGELLLALALVAAVGLFLFPRLLFSLVDTPGQAWRPCAAVGPSVFLRTECLFQGAITQHYGARTFFTLFAGLLVGLTGFLVSRRTAWAGRALFGAVVAVGASLCAVGFFARVTGQTQLLPEYWAFNGFGNDRFTFVIPNPSWVWPFLAPAFVLALWGTIGWHSWAARAASLVTAALLGAGVLATNQRGGLLLLLVVGAVCGGGEALSRLRLRAARVGFVVGSGAAAIGVVLGLGEALNGFLAHVVQRGSMFDEARLLIWKTAVRETLHGNWLWGAGYASWFAKFSEVSKGIHPYIFDTAHSLYVQLFFELGLVGLGLCLVALVGIAVVAWHSAATLRRGRVLVAAAGAAFVVATLVQEVDYIRPTLMVHALFWGALAGLPYARPIRDRRDAMFLAYHPVGSHSYRTARWIRDGFRVLLALSAFGALVAWGYFSRGGGPFEADFKKEGRFIERWSGPRLSVPIFGRGGYWLFPMVLVGADKRFYLGAEDHGIEVAVGEGQQAYLPLWGDSRFLPTRHRVDFASFVPDGTRVISARLRYPPYRTTLPLLVTSGAAGVEHVAGAQPMVRCGGGCQLALLAHEHFEGVQVALEGVTAGAEVASISLKWAYRCQASKRVVLATQETREGSGDGWIENAVSAGALPAVLKLSCPSSAKWIETRFEFLSNVVGPAGAVGFVLSGVGEAVR